MEKKAKKRRPGKRSPKVRIPLPFGKAIEGVLGLSAKDAKDVREAGKKT